MARPQKIKLDYFPLVCGFFQDERIIALRREHGALGIVTYIFLLTKVYDNGYYLKIPSLESFAQTIAENIASNREPTAKVATHVVRAIRYGADIGLIDKYYLAKNCITGVKVQEQYAKSKERYGGRALIKEFSLIDEEHSYPFVSEDKTAVSATETHISVTETPVKATETQQSKINKSKVNIDKDVTVNGNKLSQDLNEFCEEYGVTIDSCSSYLDGIDFMKLSTAYSQSKKFLQVHPIAKSLAWIIKNYASILAGKYKDKEIADRRSSRTDVARETGSAILDNLYSQLSDLEEDDDKT